MRRGDHARPWTTEDDRYLTESAGIVSKREICLHLKRSRRAVEVRASRMGLSLRHFEHLTEICPKCGQARDRDGVKQSRTGFCAVCVARAAYQEALWRQAEAYAALDPVQRAVYDATEARTGASRLPPRPPEPPSSIKDPAKAMRARELHAIDVEKWELRCLKMMTDAAKKRTQRMREKSGTNPRKSADFVEKPNE